jgi:16S rRNA (guanine(966)-N(2))-methyltransferase RsmD
MRIISGKYKKRILMTPKDKSIRPTTDRHRESLFNILDNMNAIIDANVLDLFSGTGALGIESLSRGAKSCVFVDHSRKAIQLIKNNIKHLKIEPTSKVIQCNILNGLTCLNDTVFDLILMDPPYQKSCINKTLCNIVSQQCLHTDSIIVAEHADNEPVDVPETIKQIDTRKYGNTIFRFFQQIDT